MVRGYTSRVREVLTDNGCTFLREGKGDHEIWLCPNARRPVVVDGRIMSRQLANAILKQAGIKAKI